MVTGTQAQQSQAYSLVIRHGGDGQVLDTYLLPAHQVQVGHGGYILIQVSDEAGRPVTFIRLFGNVTVIEDIAKYKQYLDKQPSKPSEAPELVI